jgi:hypothetical protein
MKSTDQDSESKAAAAIWRHCVGVLASPKPILGVVQLPIGTDTQRRIAALVIIAIICFPGDVDRRAKLISAVLAVGFKHARDSFEIYVPGTEMFRRDMQSKTARRIIKKSHQLVIKRFQIAQDILAPVMYVRDRPDIDGPTSITNSIRQFAKKNEANVRQRLWKPTLPVLHLVLGLLAYMSGDWERFAKQDLLDLIAISGPDWVPPAIQNATIFLDEMVYAKIITDIRSVYAFRASP